MVFENKALSEKLLKAGFTNNKFSCYYEYVGNCKDSKIRIGIHFYGFPPKSEYRFSVNKIGRYIDSHTSRTEERCVLYLTEEELVYMLKHFGLEVEGPGEINKLKGALKNKGIGELNLISGLRTNGRDNQYIFGGKIILSAFMVEHNSLGVININISNKEVKVGEDFSNISDDELIDKKLPLTQLVFKDRDSIDIMIEQLTLIRNKLKNKQLNKK